MYHVRKFLRSRIWTTQRAFRLFTATPMRGFIAYSREFKQRTGCPVLVNTSFNVRGEPSVCTPEDAFRCFMGTEIEYLAIGNCVLSKDAQTQAPRGEYHTSF